MKDLLLLHGAIGSKSQFDELASELKDHYHVYTLNFTGHGGTALPNEFSIRLFSEDVINYLKANQIPSIDIFGYSMGGYVALYLSRFHPQVVKSVFTFATKFNWSPEIAAKETKMLNPDMIEAKVPGFAEVLKHRHSVESWRSVLNMTAKMMVEMGERNVLSEDDYQQLTQTIQIGIGDQDNMVTLEETIPVFRSIANAKLLVSPSTPHPFERISVDRLISEIRSFF